MATARDSLPVDSSASAKIEAGASPWPSLILPPPTMLSCLCPVAVSLTDDDALDALVCLDALQGFFDLRLERTE